MQNEIDDLERFVIETEYLPGRLVQKMYAIPRNIKINLDQKVYSKYFIELNVDEHSQFQHIIYTGILRPNPG